MFIVKCLYDGIKKMLIVTIKNKQGEDPSTDNTWEVGLGNKK